jgi:hypothetical protein
MKAPDNLLFDEHFCFSLYAESHEFSGLYIHSFNIERAKYLAANR